MKKKKKRLLLKVANQDFCGRLSTSQPLQQVRSFVLK